MHTPASFPHTDQYALVQSARGALLDYCATLRPEHLRTPLPSYNNSSIRDLLVHVADAYQHWLGRRALGQPLPTLDAATFPDVAALRRLYADVDALVAEFGRSSAAGWLTAGPVPVPGRAALTLTPLALFTHVVTHEFHHKGQVLNLSRQLGYVPVDTDVIRF